MKEHDLSLSHGLSRNQRRAVGQFGDHALGQRWIGLRHHLAGDLNIVWNLKPKEGRVFAERCQCLGFSPAHGAADGAAARAQAYRHHRVFVNAADITCCDAGSCETHEHAAVFYPSGHVFFGVLVFGMIGYIAWKQMRPGILRTSMILLMASIVILMGPSRVIELDHWPADTFGSYLLAVPFFLALIWLDRHPTTQPGGRVYAVFELGERIEDRLVTRLLSGRHRGA